MLAAVSHGRNRFTLGVARPDISAGDDVLVRVRACGFCQTDCKAITTDEFVTLNAGLEHFLERRMDARFGTTPLAVTKAIQLMEPALVDPARIITHRHALNDLHQAVAAMPEKNRDESVVFTDPTLVK